MTNPVAQTIFQQLGGHRFLAMTGAKLSAEGNTLTVKLPRYRAINITLTDRDTYHVEDIKMNAKTFAVTRNVLAEDAYCDQLQDIFTDATGLATHL